jgi:hypothetical protein
MVMMFVPIANSAAAGPVSRLLVFSGLRPRPVRGTPRIATSLLRFAVLGASATILPLAR